MQRTNAERLRICATMLFTAIGRESSDAVADDIVDQIVYTLAGVECALLNRIFARIKEEPPSVGRDRIVDLLRGMGAL